MEVHAAVVLALVGAPPRQILGAAGELRDQRIFGFRSVRGRGLAKDLLPLEVTVVLLFVYPVWLRLLMAQKWHRRNFGYEADYIQRRRTGDQRSGR